MGIETALAIGVVATAVGTGVSAYSSYQQGKSEAAIQNENAKIQRRNAEIQRQNAEREAQTQRENASILRQNALNERQAAEQDRVNADFNAQLSRRQSEIDASNLESQRNRALGLKQQEAQTLATAAENRKRMLQEKVRLEGAQRVAAAKSGVVSNGTPLALLADTEYEYDRKTNDLVVNANWDANALSQEAALREKGVETEAANLAVRRIGAENDRALAYQAAGNRDKGAAATMRNAKIMDENAGFISGIGAETYKINKQAAKLTSKSASLTRRRGTSEAVGTLLSGTSRVASMYTK